MNLLTRSLVIILIFLLGCKPVIKTGIVMGFESQSVSTIQNTGVTHTLLNDILKQLPLQYQEIIQDPEFNVQIIYSQIDRNKRNKPFFTDLYFQVSPDNYFYPASTVKLPVAALALQKLNELKIPGLDKNTLMITEAEGTVQTEVYNDPNSPDGRPTIAQYIKKILLVSDNNAYNRLYEFLGQEYINNTLHNMGYEDVEIIHRLDISLSEVDNRHTNPVRFFDSSSNLIYEKPPEKSQLKYAVRNTKMGKGFMRSGKLINEPFDFSKKNRLSLKTLHNIVRSIIFPESVSENQRFRLTTDDLNFLWKYISMMPEESDYPHYDKENYWDTYVKFLFYGSEKNTARKNIRIFNKVGDAYGFLIDAAYFADYENDIEFMLSAVIHCNKDGIFNDDKYDYDTIGFPFMKQLGEIIYKNELTRFRKHKPFLNDLHFNYSD